jgi:hypothetical protein
MAHTEKPINMPMNMAALRLDIKFVYHSSLEHSTPDNRITGMANPTRTPTA